MESIFYAIIFFMNSFLLTGDGEVLVKVYNNGSVEDVSYGLSGKTFFKEQYLCYEMEGKLVFVKDKIVESKQFFYKKTNEIITDLRLDSGEEIKIKDFVSDGKFYRSISTSGIQNNFFLITELMVDGISERVGYHNDRKKRYINYYSRTSNKYIHYDSEVEIYTPYPRLVEEFGYYKQLNSFEDLVNDYSNIKWGGAESISRFVKIKFNKKCKLCFSESNSLEKAKPLSFNNIDQMVLFMLTDSDSGLSIAAPEWDGKYTISGGYEYVWPRDLYKMSNHLSREKVYEAVKKIYGEYNNFPQRLWTNQKLAPGWCNGMFTYNDDGIQHDQLGFMALLVLSDDLPDDLVDDVLDKVLKFSYDNGFCKEGVNAWEDHFGHVFSSTTGVYLQVYLTAFKKTKSDIFKKRIESLISEVDHFWNGRYFVMGFVPKTPKKFSIFKLKNYDVNDSLDSMTLELLKGLVEYQEMFGFHKKLTEQIVGHFDYMLSDQGLYKDKDDIFGVIRYSGDVWQKNQSRSMRQEKIWSVATLEAALIARQVVEFLNKHEMIDNYKDSIKRYKNYIKKVSDFYRSLTLIPEQFSDDGSYSSATPLGWSHALRLELLSKDDLF